MSMFDNIKIHMELLEFPDSLGIQNEHVFQTKDTPNQGLSLYQITEQGVLQEHREEGTYSEKLPVADDAPWAEVWASMPKFTRTKEWWEDCIRFTGDIFFYDSIRHPDDKGAFPYEFESGWIEYRATILHGKVVGDIKLVENKQPRAYSAQEIADRAVEHAKSRAEMDERNKESRKKHPSAEQKLIDALAAMEIPDEAKALIAAYREKYDRWYEA